MRRGIILVDGNLVACQTWVEGCFVKEFTMSSAGPLPPNGARVTRDLINIFRFKEKGGSSRNSSVRTIEASYANSAHKADKSRYKLSK
jgi:hypothetical protein